MTETQGKALEHVCCKARPKRGYPQQDGRTVSFPGYMPHAFVVPVSLREWYTLLNCVGKNYILSLWVKQSYAALRWSLHVVILSESGKLDADC